MIVKCSLKDPVLLYIFIFLYIFHKYLLNTYCVEDTIYLKYNKDAKRYKLMEK